MIPCVVQYDDDNQHTCYETKNKNERNLNYIISLKQSIALTFLLFEIIHVLLPHNTFQLWNDTPEWTDLKIVQLQDCFFKKKKNNNFNNFNDF